MLDNVQTKTWREWTPDKVNRLRVLWDTAAPINKIVDEFGIAPAGIWSKVRRLGLKRARVSSGRASPMAWPKERDEILIKEWLAGRTASDIGMKLGMTRNAIIGRVGRLRESGVDLHSRTRHSQIIERDIARKFAGGRPANRRPRAAFEPGQKPPGFVGIEFLNLEPWQCRYPYGEGSSMLFCGKRKMEESSYCPDCHSVCHGYVNEYRGRFTPAQMIAARAA
jgi:hypothetical protein